MSAPAATRPSAWELARFQLKASRPGLWFPTVWLYLLPPTGAPHDTSRLSSLAFWAGLFFVTFPLNHLVYGWNDLVDVETDRKNPRKDTWLFGARGTDTQLQRLPRAMVLVQAVCWPTLAWLGGWELLAVCGAIVAVLWAYNHPTRGLRGRPPGDLVSQAGYLLVVVLSAALNDAPLPSALVFAYLVLFCAQSQLIGEVMDIDPDRAAGRATTATVLGARGTKWLILGVVACEIGLLSGPLHDPVFAAGMTAFLGWLLLDQLVLFRDGVYELWQMKLFGVLGNLCAIASMGWVWWQGGFGG